MSLTVIKVPLCTYKRVRSIASSMLEKQLISFVVDEIIITVMTGSI